MTPSLSLPLAALNIGLPDVLQSGILQYGFMQRAMTAGVLTGVLCAVVGVFVVHRGLSFMGAGISHASFGGVALGAWLGVNPLAGALVFCLLVAWSIGWISLKTQVREDTAIGIFFASTMALGILLVGYSPPLQRELLAYLFGSILSVSVDDLVFISLAGGLVLALLGWFGKELLFTIFDPDGAVVAGIPANRYYFLLITLVTFTLVISIKVAGIVLVPALLVTPAAAASQLSERFGIILLLSTLFGLAATLGGLVLSYLFNTPSGATIVLLITFLFLLASLVARLRK
ncbi:MAG: metal ABC transporter permease [Deltaproteobacteria bacterium]|nr:metal ABC transporter permease [Deltaproteobacteria bacterium]MDH4122054.1 metal ABC transporter permease [Deltaproteobacteria bacterium]